MPRFLTSLLAVSCAVLALAFATPTPAADPSVEASGCPALLNYTFNRLQTGKPESLCQFRGKVLLIVNTASYCGYTHQYEGLEALYRRYQSRGLVVVGFPSNDFGEQEPGSNKEIAEFCRLTYGVQFPMFEKSSVTSLKTNPLYATLLARTGQTPKWNFHKYLVDRNGNRVESFASKIEPDDSALVTALERLLADRAASPEG
ncbi:MAG TPA: glutathione peroxidase [Casimicrobiaceae bacterium]|jgi:glutathione peroxidase